MVDHHRVEILGPGSERCHAAACTVSQVVAECHVDCEVVEEQSADRLFELGVVRTPALVVDGRVALVGRVPTPDEVRVLLGVA